MVVLAHTPAVNACEIDVFNILCSAQVPFLWRSIISWHISTILLWRSLSLLYSSKFVVFTFLLSSILLVIASVIYGFIDAIFILPIPLFGISKRVSRTFPYLLHSLLIHPTEFLLNQLFHIIFFTLNFCQSPF